MVSTGWRTACTVIVILVGAALLTFGVFVWRRQKMLRHAGAPRPEMQQRFMSSYAFDPEAHTPLLYSEATPPLPPKTQSSTRDAERYGDVDEWGFKLRAPPTRVPVPAMHVSPEATPPPGNARARSDPDAPAIPIPMPEPSALHKLFPSPALLQFPKIQFTRDTNTRLGRLPSLRISFLRESTQVVSSPVNVAALPDPDRRASLRQSTSSAPSTLSRPFATMAKSPHPGPPAIGPLSPAAAAAAAPLSPSTISIEVQSQSSAAPTARSDSVASVGHHLFARRASAEESDAAFSRNTSLQSHTSPASGTVLARAHGSASSGSSGVGGGGGGDARRLNLRVDTAWSPNVMASYSPWKGVVHENWVEPEPEPEGRAGPSRTHVESPEGQLRVAPDAWRPMPTLSENSESAIAGAGVGVSIPRQLSAPLAVSPPSVAASASEPPRIPPPPPATPLPDFSAIPPPPPPPPLPEPPEVPISFPIPEPAAHSALSSSLEP